MMVVYANFLYDNFMRSIWYIICFPANMANMRQSKPESSPDFVGFLDTAGLPAGTTLTVLAHVLFCRSRTRTRHR